MDFFEGKAVALRRGIAYYSDIVGVYRALNLPIPYFNPNLPVYVSCEHFACLVDLAGSATTVNVHSIAAPIITEITLLIILPSA